MKYLTNPICLLLPVILSLSTLVVMTVPKAENISVRCSLEALVDSNLRNLRRKQIGERGKGKYCILSVIFAGRSFMYKLSLGSGLAEI